MSADFAGAASLGGGERGAVRVTGNVSLRRVIVMAPQIGFAKACGFYMARAIAVRLVFTSCRLHGRRFSAHEYGGQQMCAIAPSVGGAHTLADDVTDHYSRQ